MIEVRRSGQTRSDIRESAPLKMPRVQQNRYQLLSTCEKSTSPNWRRRSGCRRGLRRVPCVAFLDGIGKLDRPWIRLARECSDWVRQAALRDHIARTAFTLTALSGHAQFKLHFIKSHAGAHVTCDFTVRYSAAYANDHGLEATWLAVLKMTRL